MHFGAREQIKMNNKIISFFSAPPFKYLRLLVQNKIYWAIYDGVY